MLFHRDHRRGNIIDGTQNLGSGCSTLLNQDMIDVNLAGEEICKYNSVLINDPADITTVSQSFNKRTVNRQSI